MEIAVDVEGVLANVHGGFLNEYNDLNDTDYQTSDVDHWEWMGDEIPYDDFIELTNEIWRERSFVYASMEPRLGASVDTLFEHSDRLDIVTARTGVENEMEKWVNEIAGISPSTYDRFKSIHRDETKADLAPSSTNSSDGAASPSENADLGYDVYIDDKPALVEKLGEDQMQYLVIHPYNTDAVPHIQNIAVGNVASVARRFEVGLLPWVTENQTKNSAVSAD